MAIINVDDAYILNETGAQVDKTTGIPFKNESLTEAEAAQARANIRAGGTNPNLLDNAYFVGGGSQLGDGVFPINQRGQTQYTAAGFVFDRWFKSGGVTATLDAGGLTIANSNGWPDGVKQRFPMHFFAQMNGEAITASVLYEDGTIDSGTAIIDATQNYQWLKYPEAGEIGFQLKNFQDGAAYDYFDYISFGAGANSTPKKIKAFKVEKGTISTIKNDPVPDFGEELRKCQRYFTRLSSSVLYTVYGNAVAEDAGTALMMIPLPVLMRATPTSVVWNNIRLYDYVSAASISPSSVYAIRGGTSTPLLNVWCGVSPAMTAAHWLTIQATDASAYIDISADL